MIDTFKRCPYVVFRRRAFIFYLFYHYLFVHNTSNYGLAIIIRLVKKCEEGSSPMIVCALELMLAFDRMKKHGSDLLLGCPYILHVIY